FGGGLPVELSVAHEFLGHGELNHPREADSQAYACLPQVGAELQLSNDTSRNSFPAACYDFFPFFPRAGLPGAGSGCVRSKYHCCTIPTTLLVRIYTARPLG